MLRQTGTVSSRASDMSSSGITRNIQPVRGQAKDLAPTDSALYLFNIPVARQAPVCDDSYLIDGFCLELGSTDGSCAVHFQLISPFWAHALR